MPTGTYKFETLTGPVVLEINDAHIIAGHDIVLESRVEQEPTYAYEAALGRLNRFLEPHNPNSAEAQKRYRRQRKVNIKNEKGSAMLGVLPENIERGLNQVTYVINKLHQKGIFTLDGVLKLNETDYPYLKFGDVSIGFFEIFQELARAKRDLVKFQSLDKSEE